MKGRSLWRLYSDRVCFFLNNYLMEKFEIILKQSRDKLCVLTACCSLAFFFFHAGFPVLDCSGYGEKKMTINILSRAPETG